MKRLREQEGFTLIELMVVVLIIGILVAIALPTFLGARTRAQDSAAKAHLRTAFAGAKAYFADEGSYTDFNVFPNADDEETGTRWVYNNVTPTRGTVTINLSEGNLLVLGTASESGSFFCLYANEGAIVAPDLPVVRGNEDTTGASSLDPKCLPPSTW